MVGITIGVGSVVVVGREKVSNRAVIGVIGVVHTNISFAIRIILFCFLVAFAFGGSHVVMMERQEEGVQEIIFMFDCVGLVLFYFI